MIERLSLIDWRRTVGVLKAVQDERASQDRQFGLQDHTPAEWITILGEEYGEACRGAYEAWRNNSGTAAYRAELLHVAAVAVVAIECLDRQAGM